MMRRVDFAPLPHFQESSKTWKHELLGVASKLAKHSNMSLKEALEMPISFYDLFYDSPLWEEYKEESKQQSEIQAIPIKLGNEIIKGINQLIRLG